MQELIDTILNVLEAKWASEAGIIALLATIVAILIPVAILLIDPRQDKFPLDRNIIFRKIFLYKDFTALIIPVAISYIFPQVRLVSLFATVYLAILGVLVLSKIFKWLSSKDDKFGAETFKQKERIEYLRNLKNESEILDAWSVILNSNYESINQHGLLDVFIDNSKQIKNNQNSWNKEQFWGLLRNNFDKIKDDDIKTYKRLIKTTMSYYFDRDEWLEKDKEKREINKRPPESLRQISQKLMARAITSPTNSIEAYIYFDEVETCLKAKSQKQVDAFMNAYMDDVIDCFINNDTDLREKWSGNFFKRTTITETNADERSAVLESYYRSILVKYVSRIDNPSNEIGNRLSNITEKIFVEVDPIIWFRVITFIMWPHKHDEDNIKDTENKINNWCNRARNYGVFGRLDCSIFSINDDNVKSREDQVRKHIETESRNQSDATYKLLTKIFNFSNLDFSLCEKAILRIKKQEKNNEAFKERLEIIEKTLTQLKSYVDKS